MTTPLPWVQYNEYVIGENMPDGSDDVTNRVVKDFIARHGYAEANNFTGVGSRVINIMAFDVNAGQGGDDTTAIQQMYTEAAVAGGRCVLPSINNLGMPARYGISSKVTLASRHQVITEMDGAISPHLPSAPQGSYIFPMADLPDGWIKVESPTANRFDSPAHIFRNMTFYDPNYRVYTGIILNCRDFMGGRIIDCTFYGFKGTAVYLHSGVQGTMVRTMVRNCADVSAPAVILGNTDSSTYVVQSFHVLDCRFEVCFGTYIYAPHQNNQGSNKIALSQFESDGTAATEKLYIDTDQFKNQVVSCTFNRNRGQHIVFGSNGTDFIYADCQHDGDTNNGTIQIRTIAQRGQISNIKSRAAISNLGTQVSIEGNLTQVRGLVVTTGGKISITASLAMVSDIGQYQCNCTSGYAISITGSATVIGGHIWVHTTNSGVEPIECASTAQNWQASITCTNIEGLGTAQHHSEWYDSGNRGDASVTLKSFRDPPLQRFATTFTAARTATLPASNRYHGQSYKFMRTAGGAYGLSVGGLITLYKDQWCVVTFNGTSWQLTAKGDNATDDVYNVRRFGALGDNSTDDSAAIQGAINAAQTAGGGTILFPKGTYKCGGLSVTSGFLKFVGEGPGVTRLSKNASGNMISVNANFVEFSYLDFLGNSASFTGDGIDFTGTSTFCKIRGCWFSDMDAYAFDFDTSTGQNLHVLDTIVQERNASHNTWRIGRSGSTDAGARFRLITGCILGGIGQMYGNLDTMIVNGAVTNIAMDANCGVCNFQGLRYGAGGTEIILDGGSNSWANCSWASGPLTLAATLTNCNVVGVVTSGTINDLSPRGDNVILIRDGNVDSIYMGSGHKKNTGETAVWGDVAVSLAAFDPRDQIWNSPLTAARNCNLPSTNLYNGLWGTVTRTAAATGAFNLNVNANGGLLKALTPGTWLRWSCDGTTIFLTGYGAL